MSWSALLALTLFVVSSGLMALTLSPVVIVIWIGCWAFALAGSYESRRMRPLLFLVAVLLFYPEFSDVFRGIHEKVIVVSAVLILTSFWYLRPALARLRGERATRFLTGAWLTLSLLAYIPVVVAWLWISVASLPDPPAALFGLQHETSGIKTALPVITAALTALVVVHSMRECRDFRTLRRALEVAVLGLAAISLAEWAMRRHFVPVDVSRLIPNTTRLEGFSTFDANAFGRLLLFPALLFVSAALTAPKTVSRRGWIAMLLAVTCIVLTQSRTTYVSFSLGVAVIAALNLSKLRVWWTVGVGVAWIAGLLTWTRVGEAFTRGSERLTLTSLELRAQIWRGVLRVLEESPWFGAHPSGYVARMKSYGLLENQVNSAHSLYLALGAEWGIPMIVIALLVLIVAARHAIRAQRLARRAGHGSEARILAIAVVAASVAVAAHGVSEVVSGVYLFQLLGMGLAVRRHVQASAVAHRVVHAQPRAHGGGLAA